MGTEKEMLFQLLQKLDEKVDKLHEDMVSLKQGLESINGRLKIVEEVQEKCPARKRTESYTLVAKDVYIVASMLVAIVTYLAKIGVIKW